MPFSRIDSAVQLQNLESDGSIRGHMYLLPSSFARNRHGSHNRSYATEIVSLTRPLLPGLPSRKCCG